MKNVLTIASLCLASIVFNNSTAYSQTGNTGVGTTTPGSRLTVNGSFAADYKNVAAPVTLGTADYYTAITNAGTVTLPAVATASPAINGRVYWIKNTGIGTVTIAPTGSELIDNQGTAPVASLTLNAGQLVQVVCTGNTTVSATTAQWEVMLLSSTPPVSTLKSTAVRNFAGTWNPPAFVEFPLNTGLVTSNSLNSAGTITGTTSGREWVQVSAPGVYRFDVYTLLGCTTVSSTNPTAFHLAIYTASAPAYTYTQIDETRIQVINFIGGYPASSTFSLQLNANDRVSFRLISPYNVASTACGILDVNGNNSFISQVIITRL